MGYSIADIVKDREYEDYLLIVNETTLEYTAIVIYSTDSFHHPSYDIYRKTYLEKYFVKVA